MSLHPGTSTVALNMNIQNAYDEWSSSYDEHDNLTRDLDQKVLRDALADQRFKSILEIGCGTGKNTRYLARIGTLVHAVDFSQGMIEKARQKVLEGNVRFSMADLLKRWPCDETAYDLIVCDLVLEHIDDLSHIFAEAARTLVLRGRFLINELHPYRQYAGTKARFERSSGTIEVQAYLHHISDFINAARLNGLRLITLDETWHEKDQNQPPRLISFIFEKRDEPAGN